MTVRYGCSRCNLPLCGPGRSCTLLLAFHLNIVSIIVNQILSSTLTINYNLFFYRFTAHRGLGFFNTLFIKYYSMICMPPSYYTRFEPGMAFYSRGRDSNHYRPPHLLKLIIIDKPTKCSFYKDDESFLWVENGVFCRLNGFIFYCDFKKYVWIEFFFSWTMNKVKRASTNRQIDK